MDATATALPPITAPIRPLAGGPKPDPFVGNLLQVRRDPLEFLGDVGRRYGDIVPVKYGPVTVYVLNHPDLIEEVLVTQQRSFAKGRFYRILHRLLGTGLLTSEGEFWRRQRRLAQPAFHRARIEAYAGTMVSYAERLIDGWRTGETRDVHEDMMRVTLEIVVKTLLDADVSVEAGEVGRALPVALVELDSLMNGPAFLLPDAVPTPGKIRLGRAVRRLDSIVYRHPRAARVIRRPR